MEFGALRTKVARRIVVLFVLCALLPIGALALVTYQRMSSQVATQARERLEQASKNAALELFRRLAEVDGHMRAATPQIVTLRTGAVLPSELDGVLDRFAVRRGGAGGTAQFLVGTVDSLPPLPAGADRHFASGRPVMVLVSGRLWIARSAEPWDRGTQLWAELAPAFLWDSAGPAGALTAEMELCVLRRSGELLYCPAGEAPAEVLSSVTATRGSTAFLEWEGALGSHLGTAWPLFLRYQFLADDLIVFVSQPRSVALAAMSDFRWTFVPAVLLTLWLVLLLVYVQVRRTTAPLNELRSGTQRLSALDFSVPVAINSRDEFEDVAVSFNAMATRLQEQFGVRDRLTAAVQQTSDALRESEERLRTILEAAPDGIVTADAQGIIEGFNRTAERLFGYQRDEVIGGAVSTLLADDPEGRDAAPFRTGERRARRKDGSEFPIELGVSEVRLGARIVETGFIRDISERRREEAEREKLEGHLRQAQKMETIGTLAGGIAHDFNNILTAVIGYVDLAMLGIPSGEAAHGDLKQVRAAAERAKALVRQILLFSRKAESRPQAVDLAGLVEEAQGLLRASLPATIDIQVTVADDTPVVNADPTQMHQVIMNLGTNAFHAMRTSGGQLTIDLRRVLLPTAVDWTLSGMSLPSGEYASLTVRDTGHGMDRATMERIFEPFFTTKPVGEGTGLGLSVVHGIITRHGGTITVDSEPGVGTVFTLLLPAEAGAAEPIAEIGTMADLRGEGSVLVVDDDPAIATMAKRVLDSLGYSTTAVTSGKDALGLVIENLNKFDLVVSDLTMPGLTGDQLGKALQRLRPDLRLLLVTGQAEGLTLEQIRSWGFHGHLEKPVGARSLGEAVRRVLQSTAERANT